MSTQVKCQRCEMELNLDLACCPRCGTKVPKLSTRDDVVEKHVQLRDLNEKRDRLAGVIVIGCLVILGCIVLGIYLLGGTGSGNTAQNYGTPPRSRSSGNNDIYSYGPVAFYFVALFVGILYFIGLGQMSSGKEWSSNPASGCLAAMITSQVLLGIFFLGWVLPTIILFFNTCCRPPI